MLYYEDQTMEISLSIPEFDKHLKVIIHRQEVEYCRKKDRKRGNNIRFTRGTTGEDSKSP